MRFGFKNFINWLIVVFIIVSFFIVQDDLIKLWREARQAVVNEPPPFEQSQIVQNPLPESRAKPAETAVPLPIKKSAPSAPGALKVTKPEIVSAANLDPAKIVELTNVERARAGLQPLFLNNQLTVSAQAKTADMLTQQYFEHTGPDGKDISDWAQTAGYAYLAIGENLALGDFISEADLITAWMNSPGHRANILNARFTEIGAGTIKGQYEGRASWLAVQHFGKPLSDCPTVDETLKNKIEAARTELDRREAELGLYLNDIETYNVLVGEYNALLTETKNDIENYNTQVRAYNTCVAE